MTSLINLVPCPFLAQDTSFEYSSSGNPPGPIFWICWAAFVILFIASLWKIFTKAGQPGWAAIIPIVNTYYVIKVAGRPWWWLILLLIPFVNVVIWIILSIDLAKAFGKGVAFGIGLLLLPFIFYPILAFGSAQYQSAPPPAPI
jgi:hypothetical protein